MLSLGILLDGTREVLAVWIAQTGGATLWRQVFGELCARGVHDFLIAIVDGLQGASEGQELLEAISMIFPSTTVQTDIVHLMRNSLECASHSDRKPVVDAFRTIYSAPTVNTARALEKFARGTWGAKYPMLVRA